MVYHGNNFLYLEKQRALFCLKTHFPGGEKQFVTEVFLPYVKHSLKRPEGTHCVDYRTGSLKEQALDKRGSGPNIAINKWDEFLYMQ